MFWLRQPPYLRWIVAGLVVAVGVFLDTRPAAMVDYPFAHSNLHAGQSVAGQVEWRSVPAGMLPGWEGEVAGHAVTNLTAGTPLLPELVTAAVVPKGWWSVAVTLPHPVGPGTPIRISTGISIVTGIISGEVVDSGFEYVGSVAFTPDDAALVADAVATGEVVVMIGATHSIPAAAG